MGVDKAGLRRLGFNIFFDVKISLSQALQSETTKWRIGV
jgi:hypothetical protein